MLLNEPPALTEHIRPPKSIVSKLGYQPYRSGKNPGWVKVKCRAWREANRTWEMFEKRKEPLDGTSSLAFCSRALVRGMCLDGASTLEGHVKDFHRVTPHIVEHLQLSSLP